MLVSSARGRSAVMNATAAATPTRPTVVATWVPPRRLQRTANRRPNASGAAAQFLFDAFEVELRLQALWPSHE